MNIEVNPIAQEPEKSNFSNRFSRDNKYFVLMSSSDI